MWIIANNLSIFLFDIKMPKKKKDIEPIYNFNGQIQKVIIVLHLPKNDLS